MERSLEDLLKLLRDRNNMDFCEDFQRLQVYLNHSNNIKNFLKIQYREGNEPYILELTSNILTILHLKGYVDKDHKPLPKFDLDLRKITFYLILNTEQVHKKDLRDRSHVCHILNTTAELSKCLLMCCITGLQLELYFYDMIKYTPNWYNIQFISAAIDNIKSLKPYQVLDTVTNLVKSIYMNIARSDNEVGESIMDKKNYMEKYYNYVMELLRHYYTPDTNKFSNWKKLQFYRYSGYAILSIVKMILYCFDIFENKPKRKVQDQYRVYYLVMDEKLLPETDVYSEICQEYLNKINMALLNTLQTNAEGITLDVFMYWAEVDHKEERTLQQEIGEAIYNLIEVINMNEVFTHEVLQTIQNFGIKPKSLSDKMQSATLGGIMKELEKIDLPLSIRSMWMSEFIKRGDAVLDNEECLETILENVNLLNYNDVKIMTEFMQSNELEFEKEIKNVIMTSMDNLKIDEIIKFIQFTIQSYGLEVDIFQTEEYSREVTMFFNKSVLGSVPQYLRQYLKLILQNPFRFFDTLFDECLQNELQLKTMLEIVRHTKDIVELFLEDILVLFMKEKIKTMVEREYHLLAVLLCNVFEIEIVPKSDYINILYKFMFDDLKQKKYRSIFVLITAFSLIQRKYDFGEFTAPVLLMIGQVMDETRWDILRYSNELDDIIRISIDMIMKLNNSFIKMASIKDKTWIVGKIQSFKPITKYYFQRYSIEKTDTPIHFDAFLHPAEFENDHKVIAFLCETLVRCTLRESDWLMRNPRLANCVIDSLLVLSAIVKKSDKIESLNCLNNCVLNYGKCSKVHLLDKNGKEKLEFIKKLTNLLFNIPDSLYNNLFLWFQPIISDIIKQALPEHLNEKDEIQTCITKLKETEGKQLILDEINLIK